jgi:endonuclease-3
MPIEPRSKTLPEATVKPKRKPLKPRGMSPRLRNARQKKALELLAHFREAMPAPETELSYGTPYELIVAVVLSAQCTDVRVNKTTPALFERYPTPAELACATPEEVFELIRSVSYPNNKAKHLVGLGQRLMNEFGGEVPKTVEQLKTLPGVGQKTANVVASVLFQEQVIAVDTHVHRVCNRLGLVQSRSPEQTERQLMEVLPAGELHHAHHWFILHGRYVCRARKPDCPHCQLTQWCDYWQKLQLKPEMA